MKRTRMKQRRATPRRRSPEHFVDEAYREHLRRQRCCVWTTDCSGPVEAHHHTGKGRGKGQKGSDRHMMPLCRKHHADFHAARGFFGGWTKWMRATWQDEHAESAWLTYPGRTEPAAVSDADAETF